ncbi:MAG: transketolase [Deltaproteobacteria bacterium]|nr:transketolase [Deltaproteobacteria bacterium]
MRTAFVRAFERLAAADPRWVLLSADTGFRVFDEFRAERPGQFLNVGVSEQAAIGFAAGMASEGFRPVLYGIVPFVTARCLEQIRIDICLHHLPVLIVGVGAGVTYGAEGPTHYSLHDVGAMSALPGMTVLAPGDPFEVESLMHAIATHDGPAYLRLAKSGEPSVHERTPEALRIGGLIRIREGEKIALIGTGHMVKTALGACERLSERGISVSCFSAPTPKPIDRDAVAAIASTHAIIATIEEHGPYGGLHAIVSQIVAESGISCRVVRFSMPDEANLGIGSGPCLRARHGLDAESVAERIARIATDARPVKA